MANSSSINLTVNGNAQSENIAFQEKINLEEQNSNVFEIDLKQLNISKKVKRQSSGFILMGIGAFLGFISCLLTVTNPIPELYNIILYGLTTCAILIIMWGLYFVFE